MDSGFITTGTSVCVEGTLVRSQGSKQKVELKVAKITTVSSTTLASLFATPLFAAAIFIQLSHAFLGMFVQCGDSVVERKTALTCHISQFSVIGSMIFCADEAHS